jgi:hypothetical protein
LTTETAATPTSVISEAGIVAVNRLAETNVVVLLEPFQRTSDPFTKLAPFTVRVKDVPPTIAKTGFKLVRLGPLMVNAAELDTPPPLGLDTTIVAVPAVAISAAVIGAVNWVAETNVVLRLEPFHCTTESLTKLPPLTVSVNAGPPAVAEAGLRLLIEGGETPTAPELSVIKPRSGITL